MSINYQPTVSFQGGRYLADGISSAGKSIADAIVKHKSDMDEAKGYQTILKALSGDPSTGIDPESIDKMSLPEAKNSILAAEIRRQQALTRQQDEAQAAVPGFLQSLAGNMQPQPAAPENQPVGQMFSSLGTGAVPPTAPQQPGMSALMATITSASKNPAVLQTDIGKNVLLTAIKEGMVRPAEDLNAPPEQTMIGGVPYVFKKGSREFQPRADYVPGVKAEDRMAEIDARAKYAKELQAERDAIRSRLTPKDLLSSYEEELKSLNDPANWIGTKLEDRAMHRAELNAKINALRGGGGDPASTATRPGNIRKYNPATGRIE